MAQPDVPEKTSQDNTGSGSLRVEVFSARRALPIENAVVIITEPASEGGTTALFTLNTDRSGSTQTVTLPAPPRELSEQPGNIRPYAEYDIRIDANGFYSVQNRNVPVFDGQISIQRLEMLPLPQSEQSGTREGFDGANSEILDEEGANS